ncbi:hypothetical protein E2C01_031238 [Portunus trituberculatus]|uniref:Uncharacterized protein n=1 Tax=Portunus trituberculatus TaxID=210409 RepID=A0A5B7EXK6_PORTR|nr:hypothetical protein [Portunus trituberculatus]
MHSTSSSTPPLSSPALHHSLYTSNTLTCPAPSTPPPPYTFSTLTAPPPPPHTINTLSRPVLSSHAPHPH